MLDLSNLSNEVKILLILAIGISVGYANNTYNKNANLNVVLIVVVVVAGYLIYCCVNDGQESFEGNADPSPSDNMNSETENDVYSEDSNLLNMNNVENVENNEQNENVSGSYGIENDETYKQVNK